jgi:energy-coupling factor transporter ATP-binding protein EcfA2
MSSGSSIMSIWDEYPSDYRAREVGEIIHSASVGECVAVVGLSGSGKSNLLGFIAQRIKRPRPCPRFILVDCNRLGENSIGAFWRLVLTSLNLSSSIPPQTIQSKGEDQRKGNTPTMKDELTTLEEAMEQEMAGEQRLCLLFDRFDALMQEDWFEAIAGNLRALRDAHKYRLTYVIAARRLLDSSLELAELFFGHTLWLGPLEYRDALWSAQRDARRFSSSGTQEWSESVLEKIVAISWGYPSLLRAICEAYAGGASLEAEALRLHPTVARRVAEFWMDKPDAEGLRQSRLEGLPLLGQPAGEPRTIQSISSIFDTSQLTAKEHLLLEFLLAHSNKVCEKDDLIHAVWPEDVIFQQGIRDESLAQLVRRLRVKIEPDPAEPKYIHTVPGRGYLFRD